ncbi:hypothetical protein CPB85DRAFT_1435113 [Mucidula mucida]|nr:hypothetical protein CPB85DRAFT_1435113 [Mucidula mucida]
MPPATLSYGETFWKEKLGDEYKKKSLTERIHLIFSLTMFLGLSLAEYLSFVFSSDIPSVKQQAGMFMGTSTTPWPPETVYNLWHDRFSRARTRLHTWVQACALEIAEEESNKLISETAFKIKIKDLTVASVKEILQPKIISDKLQQLAPFMWSLLHHFASLPNRYHRYNRAKESSSSGSEDESASSDWDDDPNEDTQTPQEKP